MSSLTPKEKAALECLFDMDGGYVLDFSDASIGRFFGEYDVDIHSERYQTIGSSKAKKMRDFWRIEPDELVGPVLLALIEHSEAMHLKTSYGFTHTEEDEVQTRKRTELTEQCKGIANRLAGSGPPLGPLKATTKVFDSKYITDQISRMEKAVSSDPALAIGTAKELVETCCKTLLQERGEHMAGTHDISELSKATFKALRLMPEDVPQAAKGRKIIKKLLQNLSTVGSGLAELRNIYGTGHGKDGKTNGLSHRHAKLAVGSAATLVTFLFDTHQETRVQNKL